MSNDTHFALLIGINGYPGLARGRRNLTAARNDAIAFRDWLTDTEGGDVPPTNIVEVLSPDPLPEEYTAAVATPTKVTLEHSLIDLHGRVRRLQDQNTTNWDSSRLYIYASGHGVANPGGQAALLMADMLDEAKYRPSFEFSGYEDWYEACGTFREVVILADCCRTADSWTGTGGPSFEWCEQPFGTTVTVLGLAAARGDAAFEEVDEYADPDERRSYFTRALIDGLEGAARNRQTGEVDSRSLHDYVSARVDADTEEKVYPQQAKIIGATPVRFGPGREGRWSVRVVFDPAVAEDVVLFDGTFHEQDSWNPANGPWNLSLPRGIWEVRRRGTEDGVVVRMIGGDLGDVQLD